MRGKTRTEPKTQAADEEAIVAPIGLYDPHIHQPPLSLAVEGIATVLLQAVRLIVGRTQGEHTEADLGAAGLEQPVGDLVNRTVPLCRCDNFKHVLGRAASQLHGVTRLFRGPELGM